MPTVANVISLKVAPKRTSDHAFNIAGIIESRSVAIASLGTPVSAYNVRAALYSHLADPHPSGNGRLLYDSAQLRQTLLPVTAYVISNEAMAADLDGAILRRQNQYLSRNQFVPQLVALVQATYPAKKNKLEHLLRLTDSHFQALDAVYNPAGGTSAGVTQPVVTMRTRIAGVGAAHSEKTVVHEGDATGAVKYTHTNDGGSQMTRFDSVAGNWVEVRDALVDVDPPGGVVSGFLSQKTVSVSESDELRYPNVENQIRHERVTVDLLDEILGESAFNLTVPNLPTLWANGLTSLDLEIRRLQVQYIETFLTPRLDGKVTAVMKDAGDNVRAGESVFRVEDDSSILLVGQIKCRAGITLGQSCVVETTNVFASDPPVPLRMSARVASIRGYDSERDRWNIVLEAMNPANPKLPLGYDFEPHPDYSKITF